MPKARPRSSPAAGAGTASKRARFLAELAQHCNVTRACAAAGLCATTVYRARRQEPGFAAAWNDALCDGYAMLEMLTMSRALEAMRGPEPTDPAGPPAPPPLSERAVLTLLEKYRATVTQLRAGRDTADDAATRAELEARFATMAARIEATEPGDA